MTRVLAILNTVVVAAMVVANGYSGANPINGNTIASLSDKYANLFTPAGYAFSIWGLIFLGLLVHVGYQLMCAFSERNDDFIRQIGPWLLLANACNATWLLVWLFEYTGLSVVVMLLLLVSLIVAIVRLNMMRWDAPWNIIAFVWWPIAIYAGWISVATIANIAAYLSKTGGLDVLSEVTWTVIMLLVATAVNAWMIASRNMREFAAIGIWALIAIAVRHWEAEPTLQWTAVGCAALLAGYAGWHGWTNRKTNPFIPGFLKR